MAGSLPHRAGLGVGAGANRHTAGRIRTAGRSRTGLRRPFTELGYRPAMKSWSKVVNWPGVSRWGAWPAPGMSWISRRHRVGGVSVRR